MTLLLNTQAMASTGPLSGTYNSIAPARRKIISLNDFTFSKSTRYVIDKQRNGKLAWKHFKWYEKEITLVYIWCVFDYIWLK